MSWLAPALLVLAFVAAIALSVLRRRAAKAPAADWSVQAKRVLTPAEQRVFEGLRAAFPQHVVLAQVSFERLLGMRRSHGSPAVFQRYQRLVADCVICSREFMPLIVVELKHAPHGSTLRTRAESSKAEALAAAGLVYVTIDVGAQPDAPTLRALVRAALPRRAPLPTPAGAPARAPAAPTPAAHGTPRAQPSPAPPVRRIQRTSPAGTAPTGATPAQSSRVA